jgi:hypothetical protein
MISISTSTTVNLGAIIACSSDYPPDGPVEIAYMSNMDSDIPGWQTSEGANGAVTVFYFILSIAIHAHDSGFSASFKSEDIFNGIIELHIWYPAAWGPWFSQANHIFRRLRIMSNFENYGTNHLAVHIIFSLTCLTSSCKFCVL